MRTDELLPMKIKFAMLYAQKISVEQLEYSYEEVKNELAKYEKFGIVDDDRSMKQYTSKTLEAKRLEALLNLVRVCDETSEAIDLEGLF